VAVAIIGVQIKDDTYVHQRTLHADKYTTYILRSNSPGGIIDWPPQVPTDFTLSNYSIPDIAKNTGLFWYF
jgi:hypothetical protein